MVDDYKVYSYNFVDENHKEALYWRDVGTLEAYYEANMDVAAVSPVFNLYDQSWPIRGYQRQYPPAKFVFAEPGRTGTAIDSIVSQGLHHLRRVGPQQRTLSRRARQLLRGGRLQHPVQPRRHRPPLPHPLAIIDRDVHLPEGTVIGYDTEADRQKYSSPRAAYRRHPRLLPLESPLAANYFDPE